MAGTVLKKRRLVNPGRRRRNMTAKQIKYFGTPRQKAALKNRRRRNVPRHGRRRNQAGIVTQAEHAAASAIRSVERAAEDAISTVTGAVNRGRRRKNVGQILTVIPANPGRKRRSMAARTRNRRRVHNRRHNRGRRRHNAHRRRHNRRTMNPKVVVRYRNRRHNRRRNYGRRRNPNFLQGEVGAVVGVLGGAAITKVLAGFLPAQFTAGFTGVLGTGVIGVIQGQVLGKVMKNDKLGNWLTVGGLVVAALELVSQFMPSLTLPLSITGGTSGMGLLTSSNFFVPQVNVPGSMATFVAPAAIPPPVMVPSGAKMSGLGYIHPGLRTVRRVGRMR